MKPKPSIATDIHITGSNPARSTFWCAAILIFLTILSFSTRSASAAGSSIAKAEEPDLGWTIVPSPRQAGVNLYGVSAISPTMAWAVGDIYSPVTPIIYRWNGSAWGKVSPGALPDTSLRDVVAIAANDAWAVGYQEESGDEDVTVTLHWDGTKWSRISSPNPSDENYLNGVAAVAGNDVWAVGHKESAAIYSAFVLHWNGSAWTESPTPGRGYRVLTDVAALSTNDVWAIGYKFSFNDGYQGLTLHWNGTRWAEVAIPMTGDGYTSLNGITAISPSDIWVVGQGGVNPIVPLTAHWDGASWTYVPNPPIDSAYAFLKGVTALAANDVWATGYFTDTNGVDNSLLEHWDGAAWTQIAVPEIRQAHNELWAIAPDQNGGLWTAGSFQPTNFSRPLSSLILRGSP